MKGKEMNDIKSKKSKKNFWPITCLVGPTGLWLLLFLSLPLPHKSITHEPMLERVNIRKYLKEYGNPPRNDLT